MRTARRNKVGQPERGGGEKGHGDMRQLGEAAVQIQGVSWCWCPVSVVQCTAVVLATAGAMGTWGAVGCSGACATLSPAQPRSVHRFRGSGPLPVQALARDGAGMEETTATCFTCHRFTENYLRS